MNGPAKPCTALVTGSAGGIGGATMQLLEQRGYRVIGVDLHDAEIIADLATIAGREAMAAKAHELAPDGLNIVVAAAGVSQVPPAQTIATNFFGGIATLELLRPLLAMQAPAGAIAVSSSSAIEQMDERLVEACLAGDEPAALEVAAQVSELDLYAASKRAFALWVRRQSISSEWAGAGIALNAIAPGLVRTGMTAHLIADPQAMAFLEKAVPRAAGGPAEPWQLAEAIVAIATLQGGFLIGQTIFVDGGTTAIRIPDPFQTGTAPLP